MSPRAVRQAALLCCAALFTAGCVSDRNERLAIGTRPTPSFGGGPSLTMVGAGTTDRSRWRTMVVVSPIDGVVHGPTLRAYRPVGRRADADRAGVFPLTGPERRAARRPGPGAGARGALAPLGRTVLDPVLMPYRLVRAARTGWWTWSPVQIWKRTRADRDRSAAVGGVRRQETNDDQTD